MSPAEASVVLFIMGMVGFLICVVDDGPFDGEPEDSRLGLAVLALCAVMMLPGAIRAVIAVAGDGIPFIYYNVIKPAVCGGWCDKGPQ